MSAVDESSVASQRSPEVAQTRERRLKYVRRTAVAIWAAVIVFRTVTEGFAFNRELVLLYIATGLLAASIGQVRRMLYVIRDWLPFALILIAYDLSRGAADMIGRPTLWEWPVEADRWLFFGTVPTVWLQEQLKQGHPPWWEVILSCVYMSFFILPYAVAGVLWLRDRAEWKAFVRLFVGLNFAGLVIYALVPAAPPWAAARCTPDDVEGGPAYARCMFRSARGVPDGGVLGAMQSSQDGANPWIERIVGRGWGNLNMHTASALLDAGQASVNLVAAIPSLHAGMTAAVAAFLWRRVHGAWRPLLVAYVLLMAFTLVYTAEHYVIDILLGWALAAAVIVVLHRYQGWRRGRAARLADRAGDMVPLYDRRDDPAVAAESSPAVESQPVAEPEPVDEPEPRRRDVVAEVDSR